MRQHLACFVHMAIRLFFRLREGFGWHSALEAIIFPANLHAKEVDKSHSHSFWPKKSATKTKHPRKGAKFQRIVRGFPRAINGSCYEEPESKILTLA